MNKEEMIQLALITLAGWRNHPGWEKDPQRRPSLAEITMQAIQIAATYEELTKLEDE